VVASAWARGAMPIGPKGLPRGPAVAGRGFKHRPTALAWPRVAAVANRGFIHRPAALVWPRVPAVAGRGFKHLPAGWLGRVCLRWPAGGLNTSQRAGLAACACGGRPGVYNCPAALAWPLVLRWRGLAVRCPLALKGCRGGLRWPAGGLNTSQRVGLAACACGGRPGV
jgi:hypothetical protein